MSNLAKVLGNQAQPGLKVFKVGGRVCNGEAQDKALIAQGKKPKGKPEGKKKGGKC